MSQGRQDVDGGLKFAKWLAFQWMVFSRFKYQDVDLLLILMTIVFEVSIDWWNWGVDLKHIVIRTGLGLGHNVLWIFDSWMTSSEEFERQVEVERVVDGRWNLTKIPVVTGFKIASAWYGKTGGSGIFLDVNYSIWGLWSIGFGGSIWPVNYFNLSESCWITKLGHVSWLMVAA